MLRIRKTAAAFCALAMVFGAAAPLTGDVLGLDTALTASAATEVDSGTCGNLLTWSLDSDGKLSISGKSSMSDFEDKGAPWYKYADSIKSIYIKAEVMTIGANAFQDCKNVTSLTIPSTVRSIGKYAFERCKGLKTVNMPMQLVSLGNGAFRNCSSLESITVPKGVTKVDSGTFYYCTSLKSVTLPDTVTSIGLQSFYNCCKLETINIPSGVTYIGTSAFRDCTNLKVPALPSGLTKISYDSFAGCEAITSIMIPSGVTEIEESAFAGCKNLTSVALPNTVTSIGKNAFWNNAALHSVAIPSCVTSIGEHAFGYIRPHGTDVVDETFTIAGTIGSEAHTYAKDNGIKFIDVSSGRTVVANGSLLMNLSWLLDDTGLLTINGPYSQSSSMVAFTGDLSPWHDDTRIKKLVISGKVTNIANCAFEGCTKLTDAALPTGMKSIGASSFRYCYALKNVNIPSGVTSIGKNAFQSCTELKSINIPDSVASIGDYAFYGTGLTAVSIPKSVKTIGYQSIGYFYNGSANAVKEGFVIYGYRDSAAHTYAKENGIRFVALDSGIKYGDVNGDGDINGTDAALLQQFLADWKVEIDEVAADVNCDGKVDEADVALMQQYLADWKVYLGAKG